MSKYNQRNIKFIKLLKFLMWPIAKLVFRIEIKGIENLEAEEKTLYISNHNSGALLESHSLLFILSDLNNDLALPFGFTHPSLFKIPLCSQYFKLIGAVPSSYECAEDVFKTNNSLVIFPGGNKQALRSVWQFKKNSFKDSHGWAKIALTNNVKVVPVTFKGTHFLNPILISSKRLSNILIIPKLLGVSQMSISLGQILATFLAWILSGSLIISFITFILTPLLIIIPWKVEISFHPPIKNVNDQQRLEDQVNMIMDQVYS